ncbi:hypothetical protein [Litoribrevibacter albus]|uniref:Uncharacterized protein n=1 Tax=Litoribrevibacter albus TaxID=1473156 RepID=A0AA37W9Q0_9GAMM|nr:hypothetical protein [Litoribrevibacter albus]GLQ32966.1 hypothetical protein GCM10007876_34450 [Litoribrevibacter albus]
MKAYLFPITAPFKTLALTSALALAGCGGGGGGGSSNDGGTPTPPAPSGSEVTVIDGYLENAQICIDRNRNSTCDTGETLADATDAEGKITISDEDADYPIIARIIAGETNDADQIGMISSSYELIAEAGSDVVTPFTTLAKQLNMTMADLAALLGVREAVVSANYVDLKTDAALADEARQAHLFARSIVSQLDELDTASFNNLVNSFKTELTNQQNLNTDLDTIRFNLSETGATVSSVDNSIEALFARRDWRLDALNRVSEDSEINEEIIFEDGKVSGILRAPSPYEFNDNRLLFGDEYYHEVFYQSDNLILAFDERDQPYAYLPVEIPNDTYGMDLTAELFSGHTWYHLRDIQSKRNINVPIQIFTRMEFSENTVTLTPEGYDPILATWEIETHDDKADTLTIHLPNKLSEAFPNEDTITLLAYTDIDEDIIFVDNKSTIKYIRNLLIKDPQMANAFVTRWKAAPSPVECDIELRCLETRP